MKMAGLSDSMCKLLQVAVILVLSINTGHVEGTEFPALDNIRTKTSPAYQALAVEGLISRLIPTRASEFNVSVDPSIGPANKDTFKILSTAGRVTIVGTSGVAVAWGFQHYLKYYCGAHISWGGDQLRTIPSPLPDLPVGGITVTSNDRFRYYQNVCTVSYSFVWWNWTRWEREIDWMALNGINLPLAFTGQEAIFQRVYKMLGFSDADLVPFFTGPAFLAWGRMGNIEGFGGPLPQSWMGEQLALQHQILNRMRSLGMTPALPGFAGHVPPATSQLFPNSSVTRLGGWAGFNATYSDTYLLDFNDSLFKKIGTLLIMEMETEFGTDHVYSADTFNEMVPKSSEPAYLASAGKAVYSAMATADPQAVWLMQGWLFLSSFWQTPQIKALLTSVDQGKMLLLDLFSEHTPQYVRTNSYFGQPFIWCMLHNFGGNTEMYGDMPDVNTGPFTGRTFPNSSMVGTGLTPEGIFQNDVIYEFMNENAWRTAPRNITQWVYEYSARRYGGDNAAAKTAWAYLARSLYSYRTSSYFGRYGIVNRPSLINYVPVCDIVPYVQSALGSRAHMVHDPSGASAPAKASKIWFEPTDVISAWSSLLSASSQFTDSHLYRYDLVDVSREALQLVSVKYYKDIISAYNNKNYTNLSHLSDSYTELLSDVERLLASDSHFLLGRWLESAKAKATNDADRRLYEYNARNQLTLWGPSGQILDYASKEWAGLVSGYYGKRWIMFLDALKMAVKSGTTFQSAVYNKNVFIQVEQPFTFARDLYPTQPQGDSIAIAKELYQKYGTVVDSEVSREMKEQSDQSLQQQQKPNLMYSGYPSYENKYPRSRQ